MSNQSIIEHKANMYYVEFREDFLLLARNCTFKKITPKTGKPSKASPYCKALILAILEHWTNDKRGKGGTLHIYMTYQQWVDAMYGMFGRNVVIDSIDELIGEGLVSREPYKMFSRDTFQYLLNHSEVNRRIKALPDRDPMVVQPQVDAFTSKRDPFTSKRDAFTNKSDAFTSNHNIESTYIPIDSNTEESTLPTIAPSPTASSSDEDTHAHESLSEAKAEPLIASTTPIPTPPQAEPAKEKTARKPRSKKVDEADTPSSPLKPQMPDTSMPWGTRKCLLKFDAWRGAQLIGRYKLMQASECAKGLAANYTEEQVERVYQAMNEDTYYIERGGADICDVASRISNYLKRLERKIVPLASRTSTKEPQGSSTPGNSFATMTQEEFAKEFYPMKSIDRQTNARVKAEQEPTNISSFPQSSKEERSTQHAIAW